MMDGKGYAIPDNPVPAGFKCVKVFIPDDPVYYGAFWNAYEFFGTWLAWQRDTAKRGKIAAAVWRKAFNMSRLYWPDHEGDCEMPYALRDDPTNPCRVQQSIDGGTTWTHAFNKECDDGEPAPDDEALKKAMAGNLVHNLFTKVARIYLDGGDDPDVQAWWNTFWPPGATAPTIGTAPEDYDGLEDLANPCEWIAGRDSLMDCFTDVESGVGLLDCFNDWLFTQLAHFDQQLMDTLNDVYNLFTLPDDDAIFAIANHNDPAGGGGAGFGGDCPDETVDVCRDLRLDTGDFIRNTPYGEWISGTGWAGGLHAAIAKYELDVTTTEIPPGDFTRLQVAFSFTAPGKVITIWVNGDEVHEEVGGAAGYRVAEFDVTGPIDSLRVKMLQGTLNTGVHLIQVCYLP